MSNGWKDGLKRARDLSNKVKKRTIVIRVINKYICVNFLLNPFKNMSRLNCDCDNNAAIETIEYDPCVVIFGKDDRWIFQRPDSTNNSFINGINGIEEETSWTALPDALDNTKVSVSPPLQEVSFADPDILEDSENSDGAPFATASGAQMVTAIIRNPTPEQYKSIKSLECERSLSFYRVDANGNFGAKKLSSAPDTHVGIPISRDTFVLRDPSRGGTKTDVPYKMTIQFYLAEGWFGTFDVIKPESGFDPGSAIRPTP